ncbi:MAG: isochorismatase family protein [Pseudomonadota bacterium]|nr:isochorismatase family protein [Pseudomonadota bacterium]
MLLASEKSQLLVIDIQDKVLPAVRDAERVVARTRVLIESARRLDVPILVAEHCPKALGATVAEVRDALGNEPRVLAKTTFSCARDAALAGALADGRRKGRPQVAVAGIESHVCVLQSVLDLNERGYDVFVVADAVSSREPESRELALARMRQAGIATVNTEMTVFEWLERGDTPQLKALLPLLK